MAYHLVLRHRGLGRWKGRDLGMDVVRADNHVCGLRATCQPGR